VDRRVQRLDSGDYKLPLESKPSRKAAATRTRRTGRVDLWVTVAAAAAALGVVLPVVVFGAMDASNTTLIIMGFDPDRAQLITSLLVGAVAAAAATLITGRFGLAAILGFIAALLLFAGTFTAETAGALQATGVDGAFDLGGWLVTLLALVMAGLTSGWAGAALAATARPAALPALVVIRQAISQRRIDPRAMRRPLALVLVLVLLVVAVPAFGDLVNYAPDSLMRRGAAPVAVQTAAPADSPSAGPHAQAGASSSASPSPRPTVDPSRPWLAWLPSGNGVIKTVYLAAPWTGGKGTTVDVTVYTPPGYDPNGSRRYPVIYEAPTGYRLWDGATNARTALDTLIDSGAIPATIVVFIDSIGGPYPDTECADSFDHRQWYDTFASKTVVAWTDAHFLTIAEQRARAIMGMSEGGYCAAILLLRHPDVFGTSISFSGYYEAGGGGTVSTAPFGTSKTSLAAASPTIVAGQLDMATRAKLYLILIDKPGQPGFGAQAAEFARILAADGYAYDSIIATDPHGWPQVRDYFPRAVEALAARELNAGVFQ
jgi:S-formylglutathione hydrolase FrmB